jgi:hypothetical protein
MSKSPSKAQTVGVVSRNGLLAGGKRQKRPAEPAFPEESRGEAPMATEEGPNQGRRSVRAIPKVGAPYSNGLMYAIL